MGLRGVASRNIMAMFHASKEGLTLLLNGERFSEMHSSQVYREFKEEDTACMLSIEKQDLSRLQQDLSKWNDWLNNTQIFNGSGSLALNCLDFLM